MTNSNKDLVKVFGENRLLIHSWNKGTKTLDFDGDVFTYLKKYRIGYTIGTTGTIYDEKIFIEVKMTCGSIEIQFNTTNLSEFLRTVICFRLSYLGDKSSYKLDGKERTFNH